MINESNQKTLEQLCEEKGVSVYDVYDLLELYDSDEDVPEDELLDRIAQYPEKARALVSAVISPPFSKPAE